MTQMMERGEDAPKRRRAFNGLPVVIGVVVWAALLRIAWWWGHSVIREDIHLDGIWPFTGWVKVLPLWRWAIPLAVGGILVVTIPSLAWRLRWRPLLLTSWLAAGAWATALASTQGRTGFIGPIGNDHEYVHTLPHIEQGVLTFVRTFVEQLPAYPTHTRGHPPGPVLVLYALQQLGLPVLLAEVVLVIAAGSSAVAAVAVTVRLIVGEDAARRTLPFLVLAPMALWVATSMDAFFLGVSAWGVAILTLATAPGDPRRRRLLAVVAGLMLGFGLYLSYALLPFGLVPLAVVAARRSWRLLIPAGLSVAVVVAAFTLSGFWWFAGVEATHAEWAQGIGQTRPYDYFLLANIAVLGFMIGPATAAGVASLRETRTWWLVGAALIVVVGSNLGGFERGEVERIWLPFAIWLIPATYALRGRPHVWLSLNVLLAVAFQGLFHSIW